MFFSTICRFAFPMDHETATPRSDPDHLDRRAIVYLSFAVQVRNNHTPALQAFLPADLLEILDHLWFQLPNNNDLPEARADVHLMFSKTREALLERRIFPESAASLAADSPGRLWNIRVNRSHTNTITMEENSGGFWNLPKTRTSFHSACHPHPEVWKMGWGHLVGFYCQSCWPRHKALA